MLVYDDIFIFYRFNYSGSDTFLKETINQSLQNDSDHRKSLSPER